MLSSDPGILAADLNAPKALTLQPTYEYKKLEQDREIRLLKIVPGLPRTYRLIHVNLNDSPSYIAYRTHGARDIHMKKSTSMIASYRSLETFSIFWRPAEMT
jgi:hypothetical protein